VLTVRYPLLGLKAGDRVLDLGCGGGRHAFEAARQGAVVVAADLDLVELKNVRGVLGGMLAAGQVPDGATVSATGADALRLPFPDATFDRIIASEVMEHIGDDAGAAAELARVLKPGGVMAVTVPSWLPERVCWALNDEYHAPFVQGGHVRIYTHKGLRQVLQKAGLKPVRSHRTHALHSPYWWLKCAVGPTNNDNRAVRAYLRLLTWDIAKAPKATRVPEALLAPVLGKSLVVYSEKPTVAA
jgi:SAM-dependent methyltransferase